MTSRAAILLAACLAIALTGCDGASSAGDPAPDVAETPINVRAMTVTTTSLPEYLTISGPLKPVTGTDVSTEESGVVARIARAKGSTVEVGDVIVELERELLHAEMRSARATRELHAYNEERSRKLLDAKQISRQEHLEVSTELARAEAQEDIAKLRWERAAIKAPYEGIVSERYVEPGQLVSPGTRVARVVDPYTLELAGSVSEREIGWLRKGSPAEIRADGVGSPLEGYVHWVAFEADPATGKFPVEVRVDNSLLALRPGVVGRARILKGTHEDAVVIPRDALVLLPEGPTLFIVDGERARARPVTTGADQGLMTLIREGLSSGERIVVRGQRELRDGSRVRVQEEADALDGSMRDDPDEIRARAALDPEALPTATDDAR